MFHTPMKGLCRVRQVARTRPVSAVAAVALSMVMAACTGVDSAHRRAGVMIRGSDTMLELNRRLAAAYMLNHPGVPIRVDTPPMDAE